MKISRKVLVISMIAGATLGIGLGLVLNAYVVQPKIDALKVGQPKLANTEIEDNLKRDKAVAESLSLYTDRTKKIACDAYVQGLKEQQLTVSQVIAEACKL
ncbi:hypothetical protein [Pseudomonas baetica]|uniref:hypothetical protein n=1 Tax=Pseudomonas baetica TaxID=674054 RepID=UPI00240569EE|nr:hypothetical protein [Pseudomonas baetica]MDF9778859.1 hypothetical protein [Pseudomonas baetica]